MFKQKLYIHMICSAIFFYIAPIIANAGLIIKEEKIDNQTHVKQYTTTYIDKQRIASIDSTGGMIYDARQHTQWTYNNSKGTYFKVTPAQVKTMYAKTNEMIQKYSKQAKEATALVQKQVQETMKQLSPEDRKKLQAEMQTANKAPIFKKTGAKKKVGHWHCTPVTKFSPYGEKLKTFCIADYKEIGLTTADRKMMDAITASENQMTQGMGDCDSCDDSDDLPQKVQDQLGLHDGISVEEEDPATGLTRLVSVKHSRIPDKVFMVPKGLKQQSIQDMYTNQSVGQ